MKPKNSHQLSFDLGIPNVKTIDEIASGFNKDCASILERIDSWPGNVICLVAKENSGGHSLAKAWAASKNAVIIDSNEISRFNDDAKIFLLLLAEKFSEAELFSIFQKCENHDAKLLVLSETAPKTWEISLPDLLSRTNSMPIFETLSIGEVYFAEILVTAVAQLGLKVKKSDVLAEFPRELCSFALIVKIFGHICMLANKGELPNSSELRVILRNFANSEMNKDLFDDNSKHESLKP